MTTEEQPSVKQELERKSVDFLQETLHRFETGRLNAETAVERASTVWSIVSGLVDNEVTDLAARAANDIRHKAQQRCVVLWNFADGSLVRITWATEQSDFVVAQFQRGGVNAKKATVDAEIGNERDTRLKATIKHMVGKGYQLIHS